MRLQGRRLRQLGLFFFTVAAYITCIILVDLWDGDRRLLAAASLAMLFALPLALALPELLIASCPRCRVWMGERVVPLHAGSRYFRCPHCGGRYKRAGLLGPLVDASGPKDERYYRPRSDAGTWRGAPVPGADRSFWAGTLGRLLVRKVDLRDSEPPLAEVSPGPDPIVGRVRPIARPASPRSPAEEARWAAALGTLLQKKRRGDLTAHRPGAPAPSDPGSVWDPWVDG
jgi:hypothetical protein